MRFGIYHSFLVITFFLFLSNSQIGPIFPLYAISLGASIFELGLIVTVSFVVAVVIRVPVGIISDRVGRWPILYVSMLILAIAIPMNAFVPRPEWLFLTKALITFAYSSFQPTAHALASSLTATFRERGKAFGMYLTVTVGFGGVLGSLICTLLTAYLDLSQVFLVMAIPPLLGLISIMMLRPRITSALRAEKTVTSNKQVKDSKEMKIKGDVVSSIKFSLSWIAKSRNMLVLIFTIPIFYLVSLGVAQTLYAVYAKEAFILSPAIISSLFLMRSLLGSLERYPLGRLSDRFERKTLLIASFFLMGLTFVLFSIQNLHIFILGTLLFELAFDLRMVTEFPLIADSAPKEDTALALALILTVHDIGSSAGSFFAGATATFLPVPTIFFISALMMLIITPFLFLMKENRNE